mmetsp:Transcript_94445/g.272995  ORF Transcript_94445/g.272995 Transcript_94445/m.272995 type:complete len:87 (-) Transcript_94445:668-928(-)
MTELRALVGEEELVKRESFCMATKEGIVHSSLRAHQATRPRDFEDDVGLGDTPLGGVDKPMEIARRQPSRPVETFPLTEVARGHGE